MNDIVKSGTSIATALIGVAMMALLVSQAKGTATVIQAATSGFNGLLQTVTLQGNSYGNPLASY